MIFAMLGFALRRGADLPAPHPHIANVESNNTPNLLHSVTPLKKIEGPEY